MPQGRGTTSTPNKVKTKQDQGQEQGQNQSKPSKIKVKFKGQKARASGEFSDTYHLICINQLERTHFPRLFLGPLSETPPTKGYNPQRYHL
jgi:hypothetical protein